jgi:alpha-mannosidase
MLKFLSVLIFVFCFMFSGFAQESLITYSRPFSYEKVNGKLVTDAKIYYEGSKKNLTIELGDKRLAYQVEGDSLLVKLPLIGDKSSMVFKEKGHLIKSQEFSPYISADWNYFGNGTIDIINTSHQDIAWMSTPDSCKDERIHKIIIPALEMSEKNPGFGFGMEQTLNLREILDEYPNYKPVIKEAYQKKIFSWGATFNQPYEGMLSNEQLVRELYLGRKWIHNKFDGQVDSHTAFNMDVPGRTEQFPQILSKAGVKYLVVSRMKEGFYNWYSPDGSKVLTYSPGNYGWASMFYKYFDKDAPTAMHKLGEVLKNWNGYYASRNIPPHYGVVISNDAAGPVYYKQVIEDWNKIVDESGVSLPRLKYSTAEDFLSGVDSPDAKFDSISGERPNLWLYIHGPAHYEAIKAKKEAGIHLPAAEMFTTINCLVKNDFSSYPQPEFHSAWYKSIYDDHGWGGKHGEITDSIFSAYLHQANSTSQKLLYKSLESIGSRINLSQKDAVIVFNDLWKRKGVAKIILPGKSNFSITDNKGREILSQNISKGDSTLLEFSTDSVPSIGYATYYLSKKDNVNPANHTAMSNYCENAYYKIGLGDGGISTLYDKELQKEILNSTRFAGGDVMDLGYDGNGAGEFTEITSTNMSNYDKLSNHRAGWKIIEDGNLFTIFQASYKINKVDVIQRIKVYHQEKKIEFQYEIPHWPGVKNRQLRFALPMNSDNASISYDVPMGVSTVGQSELKMRPGGWAWGGTYLQKPEEIHPREVQNFVSGNAADFGLTMSSGISVFDWIDPTVDAVTYPVIQAIMLSSHKSCHGEGNWYLQEGPHSFKFAITTHKPGWENGYAFGIANNHDFYTIMKRDKSTQGILPSSLSFIKSSSPFVQITAFKKSDDGSGVILRSVEMKGKDENVSFEFYKPFKNAQKVNLIEEEAGGSIGGNSNLLKLNVTKNSIESYKIEFP